MSLPKKMLPALFSTKRVSLFALLAATAALHAPPRSVCIAPARARRKRTGRGSVNSSPETPAKQRGSLAVDDTAPETEDVARRPAAEAQRTFLGFTCYEVEMVALLSCVQMAGSAEEGNGRWLMPVFEEIWGVGDAEKAHLGTAVGAGLMVGSFSVGFLADLFGRRKTFIACLANYVVFGVASAMAPNFPAFCALRFLANLGGGAFILIFTIMAELLQSRNEVEKERSGHIALVIR